MYDSLIKLGGFFAFGKGEKSVPIDWIEFCF